MLSKGGKLFRKCHLQNWSDNDSLLSGTNVSFILLKFILDNFIILDFESFLFYFYIIINIVVTTSSGSVTSAFTNNIICFKEGSKILTDTGYKLVQDLINGDLVKTVSSGFKKIQHIGYSKMYHNVNEIRSKDKLYKCCKTEYPELTEDLIITGCHSILVKSFKDPEQMEKTQEVLGRICVTEKYYRLPACVDDRTKIFEEEGVHTIWHFSLENSDYYMNYGVYANGLLVETTSNRMMVELSGMTLI